MLFLAAISAYKLRFSDWAVALREVQFALTLQDFLSVSFWVMLVWLFVFAVYGLYTPNSNRKLAADIVRIILATFSGLAIIALAVLLRQQPFDSRFLVVTGWGFATVYVIIGRVILRAIKGLFYRMDLGLKKVVIIGSGSIAEALEETFQSRKELGYKVVGNFKSFNAQTKKSLDELEIDELLITNPRSSEKAALSAFDYATSRHIDFSYSADLFSTLTANTTINPLGGVPVVSLKPTKMEGWGRVTKRFFDVVISLLLIGLLWPIYAIVALAILLETGRPIIYKNKRVGLRGNEFNAYKFRSMYQKDSTGEGFGGEAALKKEKELIKKNSSRVGPIYKVENDPRVTPIGRFIRRWSIDELPQFFNVLEGSMSIVGPRPHQPREVAGYQKRHRLVFNIRPGVTGLAQISGRSDLDYDDEMRLDVLYVERWSLWLDFIIFIKTPFILLKNRRAG